MTKRELIRRASLDSGLLQKDLQLSLEALTDAVVNLLCESKKIHIKGFGTFEVYSKEPRKCRHPKTGEFFISKPKRVVKVTPHATLLERLNDGLAEKNHRLSESEGKIV